MNYVITGSLGNISKLLAEQLVNAGHNVTVITSRSENAAAIEAIGAKASVGSVTDADFLTKAFTGADVVYTMVPPMWQTQSWIKDITNVGANYATAIKNAGVKYVVNLSSVGGHMPEGCGPVSGLNHVENILNELDGVNIKHLRPGFFYVNFLANIPMIKHMNIIGGNYGENAEIPLVHPKDIAAVAAKELSALDFEGKTIRYIISDFKTTNQVAQILGTAINKSDLPWINFTDEQTTEGFKQAGLNEEITKNYVEMGAAIRSGEMRSDLNKHLPIALEPTRFEEFAKEFALAYNAN